MLPYVKSGTLVVAHYCLQMLPSIKTGTIMVAPYLQTLPPVKNRDSTGSILFANAAICEVGDISDSILSANAAV